MEAACKALIVYFDNGARPIFRECFRESGIECHSWRLPKYSYKLSRLHKRIQGFTMALSRFVYYYPEDGQYPLIIVFDTKVPWGYVAELRRRCPSSRVVFWYWNEVHEGEDPRKRAANADVWSYSTADCARYGLRRNTPFYFDSVVRRFATRDGCSVAPEGLRDFVFMGRDKGRSSRVDEIAAAIRDAGWGCDIQLFSGTSKTGPNAPDDGGRPAVPYDEWVAETLSHKGILDVVAAQNGGPSLRVMESVFFHKKLITTNRFVTEYDFYDPNNMYVWGHSEMGLREFLDLPYRPVPHEIAQRYLLSSWLARFEDAYEIGR